MSTKFKEVKQLQYAKTELEVLEWWKKNSVFEKSLETRQDGIPFTFYEGPPTANGRPGIHHVMARTVKDLFCRYKTLKGCKVDRKGGWDTHGLPVEIEVEKELGLQGRSQVEEYGIAEYNARCRESVLRYKGEWDRLTDRMGYWVDLDDPYVTFDNSYIESVWWSIKQLFDKGLIYKGYKIQWYSPGSGTVLSSHEVSLGYKEVQDPSVYVTFKADGEENTFFMAWTTTPWTLISNMVLAVHPELDYVKVRYSRDGQDVFYYMAKALLGKVLNDGEYEVVEELKGSDLAGRTYEPLFPYALNSIKKEEAWRIVTAEFVTLEDGTGIVHIAPAFGADDYEVCRKEGIPMFNPVNREGRFDAVVEEYAGQWFKDADKAISRDLKERGQMFRHETCLHNYPHDWRKGTPLMSYPVESWFIRTTEVRDRMVELNKTINWKPASTGSGRFGVWLENNVDWAISRQRYWGTPLPIWVNDSNPEEMVCIGSIEELREKGAISEDAEIDLHRPWIDDITWKAEDGGTMRRIPDLLDVWFDSGAMPFAQRHYPFDNKELFKENFPADFIAEGVDQTRGWFYTLHAIATMLFDKPAYKNVVSNGLVLDAKGEKMSKTKGNTVDPFEIISKYGADTTRWYMMSNSSPWENLKFSEEGLQETQRKFFNTLVSMYSFMAMYANIDKWNYSGTSIPYTERSEMDRWIISRQFSTIKAVDSYMDEYEPTRAVREIERFADDLSNWYVRRNRRRFWKEGKSLDKTAAYQTLYECLVNLAKISSPFAPFLSEWLYRNLNTVTGFEEESVHLTFYPSVEETAIDRELEYRMDMARTISSIVLRIRNKINVNVRQPLARIIVPANSEEQYLAIDSVKHIILDEVNVKRIEYVDDDSGIVQKSAKPDYPALGKRLGKRMKAVAAEVRELSTEQISEFEKKGEWIVELPGEEPITLTIDDIEVSRHGLEGWSVESEDGVTVALDTELDEELIREGIAREVVNRVQNMRKEASFELTDRIDVYLEGDDVMKASIEAMQEYVKSETLAESITFEDAGESDFTKQWDIDGRMCTIAIQRNTNF
ncbi:isoleucine--tRNA ligase [Balneolaceae bacterium ANBcel3]|nr:isoleucine--tRNA ligase [Balneolaceae bacterium ANBcel3]